MSRTLTSEELATLRAGAAAVETARRPARLEGARSYNFRRPDRISREQIHALHLLHDRFARNLSTSLAAYLRTATEVSIVSVEQFTYSEFLLSVPDPTAFYALSLRPIDALGAFEINPVVAFTMIDRMLGGTGQRVSMTRALTEIEQNVVDAVVKLILDNLSDNWAPLLNVKFQVSARETRPQMVQVAAPNDTMVLLVFDIKVSDARGMMNLCLPASIIEACGSSFSQSYHRARREATAAERQGLIEQLGRVPLQVTALLETSLSARELLRLRPGDVLSLGHSVQHPLCVRVGRVEAFAARPVRRGGRAGVQIVSAADVTNREGVAS